MKQMVAKLGMALLLMGAMHSAKAHFEEYDFPERSNCCSLSYECGPNPLYCGAWDVQFQVGAEPIRWKQRSPGSIRDYTLTSSAVDLPLGNFKSLFRTPWVVGGQIGYHQSENVRLYVEFNYAQARAKQFVAPTLAAGQSFFCIDSVGKYKVFDAYVGLRYYTDRCWCDRVAFFLGGQLGLTHHSRARGDLIAQVFGAAVTPLVPAVDVLEANTVVSGGANFGFDVCICGNWSFVVTGQVLASCGPSFNRDIVIPVNTVTSATNIIGPRIGSELRFPITAGIRYSF